MLHLNALFCVENSVHIAWSNPQLLKFSSSFRNKVKSLLYEGFLGSLVRNNYISNKQLIPLWHTPHCLSSPVYTSTSANLQPL